MLDPILLDDRGSFAWVAPDRIERASCALALDGGSLVVDPVDAPGLDEALARIGPVRAVIRLLDRHGRDAGAVAARHGVRVALPAVMGGEGVGAVAPGVQERTVVDRPGWREAMLWLPDRALLISTEVLGTAPHYLASDADPLGVHPLVRLAPPRGAFDGLEPSVIAVGHGRPVLEGAAGALREALGGARRELPRAWAHAARSFLRPADPGSRPGSGH